MDMSSSPPVVARGVSAAWSIENKWKHQNADKSAEVLILPKSADPAEDRGHQAEFNISRAENYRLAEIRRIRAKYQSSLVTKGNEVRNIGVLGSRKKWSTEILLLFFKLVNQGAERSSPCLIGRG